MHDGIVSPPPPTNEPVRTYAPGSPERARLEARSRACCAKRWRSARSSAAARSGPGSPLRWWRLTIIVTASAPTIAAGRPRSSRRSPPRARRGPTGRPRRGSNAPRSSCKPRTCWPGPWRDTLNAATMLGQSKTAHQAEIDAACELIDFWRFNPHFLRADLRRAAGLARAGCGTSRTTARSKASCSRSRPSTSPRSAATSPPRPR